MFSSCRHCSGSARGTAMAGQGCPSGNMHRAQSPALSVCRIPLAPDSQIVFFKEGSDTGRASATTANSRQPASSEHPKHWGIGRVPPHQQGRTVSHPPPLSAGWGTRQGTKVRVFLSDTAHPSASLYLCPVPTLRASLVCLWWFLPPSPSR